MGLLEISSQCVLHNSHIMTFKVLFTATVSVIAGAMLFMAGATAAVPLVISNQDYLDNPNLVLHYVSKENLQRLEDRYGDMHLAVAARAAPYFELFTPERDPNRDPPTVFSNSNFTAQNLLAAGFKPDRETKIITHGFRSRAEKFHQMAKAFLASKTTMTNVFVLDWSYYADNINYFADAKRCVEVGKEKGQLLAKVLIDQLNVDPSKVHAIGHSLGAHVVGHIGRTIEQYGGKGKIARVTGLDPAKPWFDFTSLDNRIHKTDATVVDIIHTNSGELWQGCLSFPPNLGDVDFFPNGGERQVGCGLSCNNTISCYFSDLNDMIHGCSHDRSHEYYTESIEAKNKGDDKAFQSYDCNGYDNFQNSLCSKFCFIPGHCAHMGELFDVEKANVSHLLKEKPLDNNGFYLRTNPSPPYSKS